MVVDAFAEAFAKKVSNGWVLASALVLTGLFVISQTYPKAPAVQAAPSAGSTPQNGPTLWFPIAGLVIVCGGFYVGLRQLRLEADRGMRDSDVTDGKREVDDLRHRFNDLESAMDSIKGQLSSTQNVIEALIVLTRNDEQAFVGFLDGIVRLCRAQGGDDDGYSFWVKLYLVNDDGGLDAKYASRSAPSGATQHHLREGQGAAGKFLQAFDKSPTVGPQCYSLPAIKGGLGSEAIEELQKRGVRSVLCAAVRAHEADPDGVGKLHFRPVPGPEGARLLGVLCFCSTLEGKDTSLDSPEKKRACQFAANLAGAILQRESAST